jgi:hypothetical protein
MTLIEAIKSGKKFKRAMHTPIMWVSANPVRLTLDVRDILADDWEVEEKKVTITRADFDSACERAEKKNVNKFGLPICLGCDYIAKELGLD